MNDEKKCPVCGSSDLKKITRNHFIDEAFDCQKTIEIFEYHCNACESSGDFFDENDIIISNELKALKNTCVTNIISDFVENNISMSSIERALELPQRTLAKWKSGNTAPSASGVALMKFLKLFPWLIEVAEHNYDYDASQKIFLTQALNNFLSSIEFKNKISGLEPQGMGAMRVYFKVQGNILIGQSEETTSSNLIDVIDNNYTAITYSS